LRLNWERLSDDELTAIADELFVRLEQEEALVEK
jgi:hypothetical protein